MLALSRYRLPIGGRISGWLEGSLLSALPQYQMMKSMAEGLAQIDRRFQELFHRTSSLLSVSDPNAAYPGDKSEGLIAIGARS